MSNILSAGTPAPDFTLPVTPDQKLSLQELRGHPVILAFYPADGVWCHRAFAEARHLHFPLLSDFEPKGAVARRHAEVAHDGSRRVARDRYATLRAG
jgi:peroxiredoxin